MNPKSVTRFIGTLGVLVGVSLIIVGFAYPTSQDVQVEHIDDFNGEYITEYGEREDVTIVYDDVQNVTPSQVHNTYNSTEFTNTTIGKMKDIIGTNNTFSIEENRFNVTNTGERFIVDIDDTLGEQVYLSQSQEDGSLAVSVSGILILIASTITIGTEYLKRESQDNNDVFMDESGEWKYYVK